MPRDLKTGSCRQNVNSIDPRLFAKNRLRVLTHQDIDRGFWVQGAEAL
jgi:hypothetical protein